MLFSVEEGRKYGRKIVVYVWMNEDLKWKVRASIISVRSVLSIIENGAINKIWCRFQLSVQCVGEQ